MLVHIPTAGYVGVGSVVGEARRFDEALVEVNGVETTLQSLPLAGSYRNEDEEEDENAERVVPVEWFKTVPRGQAVWKNRMFANQDTAARLRQTFSIEQVTRELGLDD